MVIHEFGYPYKDLIKLKDECRQSKIPIIENCAWTYGTKIDDKHEVGTIGDFAIYSLPKILPLQYGGILKGISISDKEIMEKYHVLDSPKNELIISQLVKYMPKINYYNRKRRNNWFYLSKFFSKKGFETLGDLQEGVYPAAIIVKAKDYQKLYERYLDFGVETARYYHEESIILPIHQNITKNQLDYLCAIFSGQLKSTNV